MARRARLAIANVVWHIIQRGNNRSACFFAEEDYRFYLCQLQKQSTKHGCAIHAYCLMTNHVHLLLTPQEASGPSQMMKHLGQCFVQYINRTYKRSGTLWEGRFKSCLAQDQNYALCCYRYIELNPVRANMVSHPRDYRWSSFSYNGDGVEIPLINAHSSYLRLGENAQRRQRAYRSLVESGISDELVNSIRTATNGNYVLGNEQFGDEMQLALNRRVSPGRSGRPSLVRE